jgi:hypothetical protein
MLEPPDPPVSRDRLAKSITRLVRLLDEKVLPVRKTVRRDGRGFIVDVDETRVWPDLTGGEVLDLGKTISAVLLGIRGLLTQAQAPQAMMQLTPEAARTLADDLMKAAAEAERRAVQRGR